MLTINSVNYTSYRSEFVYKDTITSELEQLTLIIQTTSKPSIEAWEIATFDLRKWIVLMIGESLYSKANSNYETTLTLFELTKWLERITLPPCSFTHSGDSLYQQFQRLAYKVDLVQIADGTIIQYEDNLINLTASESSEEHIYTNPMTFREIADDMLARLGVRVYVQDITFNPLRIFVTIKTLDVNGSLISLSNIVNSQENQNGDLLAREYETYIKQAQSKEKYEIAEEWTTLKPISTETANDKNIRAVLMNPIDEIKKVYVEKAVLVTYTQNGVPGFTEDSSVRIDITDLFLEEELYSALTIVEQEEYIPYKRGTKEIGVLDSSKKYFLYTIPFTVQKLKDKITTRLNDLKVFWGSMYDLDTYNIANLKTFNDYSFALTTTLLYTTTLFQFQYVPFYQMHIKNTKANTTLKAPQTTFMHQENSIVDLDRHFQSAISEVLRNGNKEGSFDLVHTSVNDLLSLGNYFSSNYVLTEIEYAIGNTFIKAHYSYVKDYCYKNERIEIARQRRLSSIAMSDYVYRDICVKNYLNLSLAKDTKDTGLITENPSLTDFLKMFTLASSEKIDRFMLKYDDTALVEYGWFVLNATAINYGKSMIWQCEMEDNFSVALSTDQRVVGGRNVRLNRYVDSDGQTANVTIKLVKTALEVLQFYQAPGSLPLIFEDRTLIGRSLPLLQTAYNSLYVKRDYGSRKYVLLKDNFEQLAFTYQLEPISLSSGNIVIGAYFSKYSTLLFGTNATQLYYYTSTTELYKETDILKCKGTKAVSSILIDTTDYFVECDILTTSIKSWAIGDTNGNLLFAVNTNGSLLLDKVYFTISRERV